MAGPGPPRLVFTLEGLPLDASGAAHDVLVHVLDHLNLREGHPLDLGSEFDVIV